MKLTGREFRGIMALLILLTLTFATLVALRFCRPPTTTTEVKFSRPTDSLASPIDSLRIIEPAVPADKPPTDKPTRPASRHGKGTQNKLHKSPPRNSPVERSVKRIQR